MNMYGVSKITCEENVMLSTFPDAEYSASSLSKLLNLFADAGLVVDMICQSTPHGETVDFSFTTNDGSFAAVMKVISAAAWSKAPLVSTGYVKLNLFGEDMVTSCGVAARALTALGKENIEIALITTSDLDISLLVRDEDEDTAIAALSKAFAL